MMIPGQPKMIWTLLVAPIPFNWSHA